LGIDFQGPEGEKLEEVVDRTKHLWKLRLAPVAWQYNSKDGVRDWISSARESITARSSMYPERSFTVLFRDKWHKRRSKTMMKSIGDNGHPWRTPVLLETKTFWWFSWTDGR
jgi:hypothetical protein